ncbi:solute carrier family 22 member 13-like [Solea senegalensis]|uniref:Solute carrier family 22 member 13-like n=1 Tax=Solea senegalensis TaxID=28829 RepID=A0AAV6TC36_SOLSE|nr:solute carrier family 22 member 13-like [Solea senegalensis]
MTESVLIHGENSDPDRHCNTDWILAADSNLTADEQLDLTLPREENGTFSQCRMFVPVDRNISVIRQHRLNETTGCLNGWVYYNTQYKATIVTDFDFVCDMSLMPGFVQTVFMAGSVVGAFIFGPLAQSYGCRRSTQLPAVLQLIFVLVMALSPNYSTYLVSEFILATEWIGVRRSLATCICQLSSTVGQIAIVVLMYFVRDWRIVQYILTGMQAVVFVYICSLLIVSGALVILLPETRDKDLPDSADFLENNRSDATKQSGRVFNTAENNGIEATKF